MFCFSLKKKKFENHHPEKEYFIHAGLSNEGENIQYSNGIKKKKSQHEFPKTSGKLAKELKIRKHR